MTPEHGGVAGAPGEITWSAPDGENGTVEAVLRMDGDTAFYLARPLPEGYQSPSRITRTADDSITIETEGGPWRIEQGDDVTLEELRRGRTGRDFPPDLTIRTSDGWSCSLKTCGSMG